MLEHLSPKFKMQPMEREPRAALILNRFTRTLTVMFATNAVSSILGVRPDQIQDKSFYECIAENCLADAIKCLESAKANDSIAYLRFWYRDPRRDEDFEEDNEYDDEEDDEDEDEEDEQEHDEYMTNGDAANMDSHPHTRNSMDVDVHEASDLKIKAEAGISPGLSKGTLGGNPQMAFFQPSQPTDFPPLSGTRAYQQPGETCDRTRNSGRRTNGHQSHRRNPIPTFELEAVVSCTSDGLVVVLRRARPPIPSLHPPLLPVDFENGLFAAPWSEQPIRPYYPPEHFYTFRPPLLPQYMPLREHVKTAGGPPIDQLMKSIRDVAVFAWALVGINGNLAAYGRGVPRESSQPHDTPTAWDPNAPQPSSHPQQWGGLSSQEGHQPGHQPRTTSATKASDLQYMPAFSTEAPQGAYNPASVEFNSNRGANLPAWPHSGPYTHGFESWRSNPPMQQPPQPPQPPSSGFHPHLAEPWAEGSVSYTQRNVNNYAIPTTQAHTSTENVRSYRDMWN